MNKHFLFLSGSLIFAALGICHILIHLLIRSELIQREFYRPMISSDIQLFGSARNMWELMEGFSIGMGSFMVFYGLLNLLLLKKVKEILSVKLIPFFNASVAVVIVIFSLVFFHWPPVILFTISAICFFTAAIKREKMKIKKYNIFIYTAGMVLLFNSCTPKLVPIEVCKEFIFDLSDGTLNGVKPNLNQAEIKEWLPCFTTFSPDGGSTDCGGAILYKNHDFYFYTYLDDYIEIRSGFKGKISHDLLGKARQTVRDSLGATFENKHSQGNSQLDFFQRDYGCIRVEYKDGLAYIIAAHYGECETLEWCK